MGVKDLVELYEPTTGPPFSDPGSLSRRSQRRGTLTPPPDTQFASRSSTRPSPRRATRNGSPPNRAPRFLPHPLLYTKQTELKTADIPLTDVRSSDAEGTPDLQPSSSTNTWDDYNEHRSDKPPSYPSTSQLADVDGLVSSQYPAGVTTIVTQSEEDTATMASSSNVFKPLIKRKNVLTHNKWHHPVAATDLFARSAALLYLPKLDEYLASFPIPEFAKWKGKVHSTSMFPPMERLVAKKTNLDDLEHNSSPVPSWRNQYLWFGTITYWFLGFTGSSLLASFYSLQGLLNTLQIFALIINTLSPHTGNTVSNEWHNLFLGIIPNILALNFASSLFGVLIYLLIAMTISLGFLYYFYRVTKEFSQFHVLEGFQSPNIGSGWGILITTFLLTVFYLPMSTMAVRIIVWTNDLWVVPDYYQNATSFPPQVPPLGPPDQYRDPLDFCWTTTMKKNEVNFAPLIVIAALIVIASLTIWFPIRLHSAINYAMPRVDKFTELGKPRSRSEMNREYQRLLARDKNPFNFLYNAFRRGWGGYETIFLLAKFSALLITTLLDPQTCIFRYVNSSKVVIARQIVLLVAMLAFFFLQCFFAPFLDPTSNASEWISRLCYVITSGVSLAVAFDVPIPIMLLYAIYVITYSLNFYFSVVDTSMLHSWIKRLSGRVDFSIDIFSPRLDISSSSPHVKRRIWQEVITTLFLTTPSCQIPPKQPMRYLDARDDEHAPYLLNFAGTPGERHVENLKILREVGSLGFSQTIALMYGPDYAWFRHLEEAIQTRFVGPDCFWRDQEKQVIPSRSKFFGNAWWIPFPPCLVIRFDDGSLASLREVAELKEYVRQNSSPDIQRRREIRMALRALDGRIVTWPYEHITTVGSHAPWCCCRRGYKATTSISFEVCTFQIMHRGQLVWEGLQIGSGFDVQLTYSKNVKVGGDVIGVNDDWDLTTPLARFLSLNQRLIPPRLEHIETIISSYRKHYLEECREKVNVLTYQFLTNMYDCPSDPTQLVTSTIELEHDKRVRQLMSDSADILEITYDRMSVVFKSEVATWWYLFWDDFWRRNHDTFSALTTHAKDFDPHYPSSIAYRPLPRPALEQFLIQRGLFFRKPSWCSILYPGFLNMIYIRLNDIVFHGTSEAIVIHFGGRDTEWSMDDLDLQSEGKPSTLGIGAGTDHDDASIRARPNYRWEALMASPVSEFFRGGMWFGSKMKVWFGITPLWRPSFTVSGMSLDVRLDKEGRYVPRGEDHRAREDVK